MLSLCKHKQSIIEPFFPNLNAPQNSSQEMLHANTTISSVLTQEYKPIYNAKITWFLDLIYL